MIMKGSSSLVRLHREAQKALQPNVKTGRHYEVKNFRAVWQRLYTPCRARPSISALDGGVEALRSGPIWFPMLLTFVSGLNDVNLRILHGILISTLVVRIAGQIGRAHV